MPTSFSSRAYAQWIPPDVEGHWAEEEIAFLMGKGVLNNAHNLLHLYSKNMLMRV